MIDPNYKIWKKNASYLYDVLVTNSLPWPGLTCDWLPERTSSLNGDYYAHRLLYGTQCDDQQNLNSLIISRFQIPNFQRAKMDNFEQLDEGMYGCVSVKQEVFVRINHRGHVNRARHMPQNPFLIATHSSNSKLYIFDYSTHPSVPETADDFKPNLTLGGHAQDGFGLAWNRRRSGHLLSGANDSCICYYDISEAKATNEEESTILPLQTFKAHEGPVNDVSWNAFHENIFASVADDCQLMLWDTRTTTGRPTVAAASGHEQGVLCVAHNPFSPYLIATGSSDKTIGLFDVRNLSSRLHVFTGHSNEVYQIGWSPHYETVLASSSSDNTVRMYDLRQIGQKEETIFVHSGHCNTVTDFSFNLSEPWLMSSISYDYCLQLWRMNSEACRATCESQFDEI